MANLFDVYNDGSLIDHTEGEKLESGETPITISGLTADTTYDKVQVAYAGSYNKSDVPTFKTNLGRNLFLNSKSLWVVANNNSASYTIEDYDSETKMWHITAPVGNTSKATGIYFPLSRPSTTSLVSGDKWVMSIDVKGSGYLSRFGLQNSSLTSPSGDMPSDWTRISSSGTMTSTSTDVVIYFDVSTAPLDIYVKLPKLERGNKATPWTPAPEDATA